jgi:hypothetical protein
MEAVKHFYEVRARKNHRRVDLLSGACPLAASAIAAGAQSAMQSSALSITAGHIMPSFAFTITRAT